MPATIHLVRHAQGIHNLSREHEKIQDPDLTALGKEQCAALKTEFPYHDKLKQLFASPLRRAVHTCALSFGHNLQAGSAQEASIIALPEFREVSDAPCDTVSEPGVLSEEFKDLLDLQRLNHTWNQVPKGVSWHEKVIALQSRGARARAVIQEVTANLEDEAHIVIVTHGAFLHFLTNDYHGVEVGHATGWKNTEFRSYQLSKDDSILSLVETEESWERRNGNDPRPSQLEQALIREKYLTELKRFIAPKTAD